jgi:hypothetical protein
MLLLLNWHCWRNLLFWHINIFRFNGFIRRNRVIVFTAGFSRMNRSALLVTLYHYRFCFFKLFHALAWLLTCFFFNFELLVRHGDRSLIILIWNLLNFRLWLMLGDYWSLDRLSKCHLLRHRGSSHWRSKSSHRPSHWSRSEHLSSRRSRRSELGPHHRISSSNLISRSS